MIHKFTHQDVTYQVDDDKLFDKQNKEFKQFWLSCEKNLQQGFSIFQNKDISIMIYDRGGIIVDTQQESEASNG